jgi:hypothetical protein
MMARSVRRILAAAFALLLVAPVSAQAWTKVTENDQSTGWQIGQVRTPDGELHVVWIRHNHDDSSKFDMMHTSIPKSGSDNVTLEKNPVELDWAGFAQPELLLDPNGMRVFFGGLRGSGPGDPQDNLNSSSAPASGDPWTLTPGTVATNNQAYAGDMGGTVTNDASLVQFQSWSNSGGVFIHRGLDPNTPNYEYHGVNGWNCCGYSPDMAFDSGNGDLWVAWASLATQPPNQGGVWINEVDPATGARVGDPMRLPKSTTTSEFGTEDFILQHGRTPITGRVGGPGVYVGYTSGYPVSKKMRVWSIVDGQISNSVLDTRSSAISEPMIAADPNGRLWAAWTTSKNGHVVIWARRSNPSATVWGALTYKNGHSNATHVWELDGNAQSKKLDLLANFEKPSATAVYHTQIFPGLTVKTSPKVIEQGTTVKITVTVLDAGDPVQGVRVRAFNRESKTDEFLTNSSGKTSFRIGPYDNTNNVMVSAQKSGYFPGGANIRITK